ncbi:hypothetical protein ES703_31075 [subsurface metagenome]
MEVTNNVRQSSHQMDEMTVVKVLDSLKKSGELDKLLISIFFDENDISA